MKKSSKILGSIALSAALCMGTAAPAFAAPNAPTMSGDVTDTPVDTRTSNFGEMNNDNENGASTVVTVSTYTSQLNVTVPLYLPIYLDTVGTPSNGTPNAIVPSAGSYYIKNSSPVDVTVTNARYVNVNSKIRLGVSSSTSGFTMPNDSYKMALSLADDEDAAILTLESDSATAAGNNNTYKTQELGWVLAAKPTTGDAIQNAIDVKAYNGKLTQGISNEKLAAIIYTVSVAAQAAPGSTATGTVPNGGGGQFVITDATVGQIKAQDSITVAALNSVFKNGSNYVLEGTTGLADNADGAYTLVDGATYKVKSIARWYEADEDAGTAAGYRSVTNDNGKPSASAKYRVTVELVNDAPETPAES